MVNFIIIDFLILKKVNSSAMSISYLKDKIRQNTSFIFRFILFLTFLGHGLVSFGYSPTYQLHQNLVEAVNFTAVSTDMILTIQATFDVVVAVLILFNLIPSVATLAMIIYLIGVGIAAWIFYYQQSGNVFGLAESFRRFPWIFFALFVLMYSLWQKRNYILLRIGISFSFLAHGIASLGFLGLKGGHVELATKVVSEAAANQFVFYSGFTDTILGTMMLTGWLSRPAAVVGSVWLVLIVGLSAMTAFPDAMFRTGFLLAAIYVAVDQRTHEGKLHHLFQKQP